MARQDSQPVRGNCQRSGNLEISTLIADESQTIPLLQLMHRGVYPLLPELPSNWQLLLQSQDTVRGDPTTLGGSLKITEDANQPMERECG